MSDHHLTIDKFLTFKDLVTRGLFTNRHTLQNSIEKYGFPQPYQLGDRRVVWSSTEVNQWLTTRKKAATPQATQETSVAA